MDATPPNKPTQDDINLFCTAAKNDDLYTLGQYLKHYGAAIINERDDIQACALTWAAWNGHIRIVEFLLEKGANIEAKGTDDKTALGWAVSCDRQEITAYLLEKGASLDAKDNRGQTVLVILSNGDHPKIWPVVRAWLDKKQKDEQEAAERKKADARREKLKELRPSKSVLKKNNFPRP